MKKTSSFLILVVLVVVILTQLCACANSITPAQSEVNSTTDSTTISPNVSGPILDTTSQKYPTTSDIGTTLSTLSAFTAYQSVLQNNANFFSVNDKKNMNLSQLNQIVSPDSGIITKVIKFSVIDLDKDGIPEVVLWLSVNGDDYYGFLVLHEQAGKVYGYLFWYRAFYQLKDDGTYCFSGGAADHGVGTIKFNKNTYTTDRFTYCESSYDTNNNLSVSYFINDKAATREAFDAAIKQQDNKPDVTWYDFAVGNIEKVLSATQ